MLLFASLLGALFLRTSGPSDIADSDGTEFVAASTTAAADSGTTTTGTTASASASDTVAATGPAAVVPFVSFAQCGPSRATGTVENPLDTTATIDVMIEFSDGVGQFNPVSLKLKVGAGEVAAIDVPLSAPPADASNLQCMAFVREFASAS